MKKIKAISLLSGGLDSLLAIKLVQAQGVEVEALHLVSAFASRCDGTSECRLVKMLNACTMLGVKLHVVNRDEQLLELVKNPTYGYGSNINPCIDCRIQMLKIAAQYMRDSGADFLVTGEVLGQRPMSQRNYTMHLIEKQADLGGLLLRPLSARLLPPSVPEKNGWIDRAMLPEISGRSRRPQMRLAKELGVTKYPAPAGGCLLTDPQYAFRVRELMNAPRAFTMNDIQLLKYGRHLRLSPELKLIIGRSEHDNQKMRSFARTDDLLLELIDAPGPTGLLRGAASADELRFAASIIVAYSKSRTESNVTVQVQTVGGDSQSLTVDPVDQTITRPLIVVKPRD